MFTKHTISFLLFTVFFSCATTHHEVGRDLSGELISRHEKQVELYNLLRVEKSESKLCEYRLELNEIRQSNAQLAEEVFEERGILRANQDGARAAAYFRMLVCHSSASLEFQEEVLTELEPLAFGGKGEGSFYAKLKDQILLRKGLNQEYGTQTKLDSLSGKIRPESLDEPQTVDRRRAELGLMPLWEHLNFVEKVQYSLASKVSPELDEPVPYPAGFSDW